MSSHRTLLVVDDDADVREILGEILEEKGYDIAIAANGAEALDYLHTAKAPSFVLLDLLMPVMDGWAFLAERNGEPALRSIPVIVITGERDIASQVRKAHAGYFEKPIRIDRLVEMMEQLTH